MDRHPVGRNEQRDDISRERLLEAVRLYECYTSDGGPCARDRKGERLGEEFARAHPGDAECLVVYYDRQRPGANHVLDRLLTRRGTKMQRARAEIRRPPGPAHALRAYFRRHRVFVALLLAVAVVPALLAPNHPVAVYAYLADASVGLFSDTASAATPDMKLRDFLICPSQVARYRADLHEAVRSTTACRLFLIVRTPDGQLRQEPIRTWDSFLTPALPSFAKAWLYRKEIPFLGDEIAVWMQGGAFEAEGHYHTLGGMPSDGDALAQRWSNKPEIVVVNGLVPFVYVDGRLVPFGRDVTVTRPAFKMLRSSEASLLTDVTQEIKVPNQPTIAIASYLGYLKDFRAVDISRPTAIAAETLRLYDEFGRDYRDVFTKGLSACNYKDDYDTFNFLSKLGLLKAHVYLEFPTLAIQERFNSPPMGEVAANTVRGTSPT